MGIFKRKLQKQLSQIEQTIEPTIEQTIEPTIEHSTNISNKYEDAYTGEVSLDKLKVSIYTPKHYRDIKYAAVHIKEGHPTALNLSELSVSDAKTALHFISGLLFSVDGTHVKLSSKMFLVMPKLLKDEIIEEIQNEIVKQTIQSI